MSRGRGKLEFLFRMFDMIAADGRQRVSFAISNTVITLFTVAFAFLTSWLIANQMNATSSAGSAGASAGGVGMGIFVGGWALLFVIVAIIVCAACAIMCFLTGTLSQIVLVIASAVSVGLASRKNATSVQKEQKGYNKTALIISSVSLVASIGVAILIFAILL